MGTMGSARGTMGSARGTMGSARGTMGSARGTTLYSVCSQLLKTIAQVFILEWPVFK